ncbi:hypothetical protein T03_15045 [Trichinella britovi]|uniref:Uncharacterized protein n=2 Tax=Trichinella TaxID=6333 RepID=A0A0V1AKW6_TRIBR|nr:hypothetical protein T05_5871 [Trichinella murrelli]KRY25473.1 hypothetical protein T03_15045 [Trichinella britovi]
MVNASFQWCAIDGGGAHYLLMALNFIVNRTS